LTRLQVLSERVVGWFPRALSQRLPFLVLAAFLLGGLVAAWTASTLFERRTALKIAENSGHSLLYLIEAAASNHPAPAAPPFKATLSDTFAAQPAMQTRPFILTLNGVRYRAAAAFASAPPLPDLLGKPPGDVDAATRLGVLARNIARQDLAASLIVFTGDDGVLTITAPDIWRARPGETRTLLAGLGIFLAILAAIIPMAVNLAAPFQRLAAPKDLPLRLGPLASSEAVLVADHIEQLNEQFRTDQDERIRGLAAISHDLRTPVTRMRLRNELLEDPKFQAKFTADLDDISGIVDGALDLLSIRTRPEQHHRFSLTALLESLVDDYADVGKDVQIEVPTDIEIETPASVFGRTGNIRVPSGAESMMQGQPDKLRRAFSNLIDNALKYGTRARVIVLPSSADMLRVAILDDGPGIPADQIAQVMLPFVRGQRAHTSRGAGLGLAIATEIIGLHGGALKLTNEDTGLRATVQIARRLPA
jgi:signal transduction histidine kinase